MMNKQKTFYVSLIGLLAWLLLAACGTPATPEVDRIATGVAEEQAIAATLTADAQAAPAGQATPTPLPPNSPLPTTAAPTAAAQAATPTAAAQAGQPTTTPVTAALCTVVTNGLNLRPGPGTVYEPPVGALAAGTELNPIAFSPTGFPDGQWVQVQAGGQTGWVNAAAQFITCNIDPATLPAAALPPTPTPTITPLPPPPTATPTRPLFAVVPVDGDDGNLELRGSQPGNDGRNILLPGLAPGSASNPVVFRDRLAFRVEVFDPARGDQDGDGIRNVVFTIDKDGNVVHERTEQTAGYCVFGGGEPECEVWNFAEHNYRWPSGQPVENGEHRAAIVINPQQGESAQWNWRFIIDTGQADTGQETPPPEQAELVVEIVQTGPGTTSPLVSDALVFQVVAYNPAVGVVDGDGIADVEMRILNENGRTVYQHTESSPAYCAFQGGAPDCIALVFEELNRRWPGNGPEISSGDRFTLEAVAHGLNGERGRVEMQIEIE